VEGAIGFGAGWWRRPAWVGSITNTSGKRREPIGRISGRHRMFASRATIFYQRGDHPSRVQ